MLWHRLSHDCPAYRALPRPIPGQVLDELVSLVVREISEQRGAEASPAGFQVEASTRVVENDDGRWVGTGTGLTSSGITTDSTILHGEDAYEGLTAYVVIDYTASPIEFVAAIFPGEMPPFPEPAE